MENQEEKSLIDMFKELQAELREVHAENINRKYNLKKIQIVLQSELPATEKLDYITKIINEQDLPF